MNELLAKQIAALLNISYVGRTFIHRGCDKITKVKEITAEGSTICIIPEDQK
jgi:hypothetical protein